jgi:sortase A
MTIFLVRRAAQWIERVAFLLGTGCLVWASASWAQAAIYQSHAKKQLEHMLTVAPVSDTARESEVGVSTGPADSLIGLLEIPRLAVSAAVLEGDDDRTLSVAVGHLPDTALPWEDGNMALAGHRDTHFHPLEQVRVGDEVRLATRHGDFEYRVRRLAVVDPESVWVLNPSEHVGLTLITCDPFRYVGPARSGTSSRLSVLRGENRISREF